MPKVRGSRRGSMNKEILKKAIKHYGTHNQMLKCIEECGELSRAVSRILIELSSDDGFTTKESEENLHEELADVLIMIDQVMMMFDCRDKVFEQGVRKLNRLKERLNSNEQ
jgi:NTP pyrophosphatase (non-canonical NTP hydrolase)